MTATIHHLHRNTDTVFTRGVKEAIARHKLMLALIDTNVTLFRMVRELQRQDEDRRADLARLGADNEL